MITTLCFSGGGVKGFLYVGVLRFLEENKLLASLRECIGCSAGGIILFLLCIGYSSQEITQLFLEDETNEKLRNSMQFSPVELFSQFGLNSGKHVTEFFRDCLERKFGMRDIDFRSFAKHFGKNLVLCGSNLSQGKETYYNIDTTPDMSVIQALRITVSVPILFTPVKLGEDWLVDGGIYNNFPWRYAKSNTGCIGCTILSKNAEIKTFYDYVYSFLASMMDYYSRIADFDEAQVCSIHCDEIGLFDWERMEIVDYRDHIPTLLLQGYQTFEQFWQKRKEKERESKEMLSWDSLQSS